MHTTNLRKVGGSIMLAASDYSQPQPREEREWVDAPATGY